MKESKKLLKNNNIKGECMSKTVKAIETINTFQGEGADTGKRMLIIRFKYCNKQCPYCDTIIKMRNSLESKYTLEDLQKFIDKHGCGILITGGEPTIKNHFEDTVKLLNELYYPIANVETNGYHLSELIEKTKYSITDQAKTIHYMYSPKIFSAVDLEEEIEKSRKLKSNKNVFFKIVYQDNVYIEAYLKRLTELNIDERVYLMPEGKTREEILRSAPEVFDACEKYKFNFSSRSHIIYNFI